MPGFAGEHDPEYLDAPSSLRQGDILQLMPSGESEEWASHFGLLVTADCDLVHVKSGGIVTYVPVVPVDVYTRTFILSAEVEQHAARAAKLLDDALENLSVSITAARIEEMLSLGETPQSIVSFADLEGNACHELESVIGRASACAAARHRLRRAQSFDEAIECTIELRSTLNELESNPSKKPVQDLVRADIRNRLKSLPNDSMFFGALADEMRAGYVAYLRLLRELAIEDVALSPREERLQPDHQFKARRVSRLQLLYIHKLLQQMAAVFTDIGLPEDYEAHRAGAIDEETDRWLQGRLGGGLASEMKGV